MIRESLNLGEFLESLTLTKGEKMLAQYCKVILGIAVMLLTSGCGEKLPDHFGIFVKDGGKFIELKGYEPLIILHEPLNRINPPRIKSTKPEIVIYGVSVNVSELELSQPLPLPGGGPFGSKGYTYEIMVSPIRGKEKAYRVIPKKELKAGLYCLYSTEFAGYKVWPFIIEMPGGENEKVTENAVVVPKPLNLAEVQKSVEYPEIAKKTGIKGTVRLSIFVWTDGTVKKVKVIKPLHDVLDKAAVKAAYKLKFKPALQKGKPVAVWVLLPITFRLPE